MVNISKNLVQQQKLTNAKVSADSKTSKTNVAETSDGVVRTGKITADDALKELKITDVKVTQSGKQTMVSCKVGGKQVTTTVNSLDLNEAAESLAQLLEDGEGRGLEVPRETALPGLGPIGPHILIHIAAKLAMGLFCGGVTYTDYGTMNFGSVDAMKAHCQNLNVSTNTAGLKATIGTGDNQQTWTCHYNGHEWIYRRES